MHNIHNINTYLMHMTFRHRYVALVSKYFLFSMLRCACTILHLHFFGLRRALRSSASYLLLQPGSTKQGNTVISSSLISSSHTIHQATLPAPTIFTHTHTDSEIQNKAPCHFPTPKITSQFCCLFSIDHRHFCNKTRISPSYVRLPHLLRLLRLFLR